MRKSLIVAGGVAAILLFLAAVPFHTVLKLSLAKTGEPVLYVRVKSNQEFILKFIHSVNKRPVADYIKVEDQHFVVVKSIYDSFGAGMPETSIDGMELKRNAQGQLELTNINRRLDTFTVFVGTVAEHSLIINGQESYLADLAAPGTGLHFEITKISYYDLWKGRCID